MTMDEIVKEVRELLMPDGLNKRLGLGDKDIREISKQIAKNIKKNPEAMAMFKEAKTI